MRDGRGVGWGEGTISPHGSLLVQVPAHSGVIQPPSVTALEPLFRFVTSMSKSRATPENLTRDHLAIFASVRVPLQQWLLETHGRRGLREGALGVLSAAVALVALLVYDFSPLLLLLHLLIALLADSVGAVIAARRAPMQPARPFFSPAHAVAFVSAVIQAFEKPLPGCLNRQISSNCAPYARRSVRAQSASPAHEAAQEAAVATSTAGRLAEKIVVVLICLVLAAMVILLWIVPPVRAAVALFEPADWMALTLLLAINGAQIVTARRSAPSTLPNAPWHHAWFVDEILPLSQLIYWKHCKQLPLVSAFFIAVAVAAITGPISSGRAGDELAYGALYESLLRPTVIALFALSATLHLLLLAAPWHARRTVARLEAFDVETATTRTPAQKGVRDN